MPGAVKRLTRSLDECIVFHPDVTETADWALKTQIANYLPTNVPTYLAAVSRSSGLEPARSVQANLSPMLEG